MGEYTEKTKKNLLILSSSDGNVSLTVDCQFGTISEVSFYHNELKTAGCGETVIIGTASSLKGKTIEFNGASGNPSGGQIKIIHTVKEESGKSISYTFPKDYNGSPEFDDSDKEPSYVFYVKFT